MGGGNLLFPLFVLGTLCNVEHSIKSRLALLPRGHLQLAVLEILAFIRIPLGSNEIRFDQPSFPCIRCQCNPVSPCQSLTAVSAIRPRRKCISSSTTACPPSRDEARIDIQQRNQRLRLHFFPTDQNATSGEGRSDSQPLSYKDGLSVIGLYRLD